MGVLVCICTDAMEGGHQIHECATAVRLWKRGCKKFVCEQSEECWQKAGDGERGEGTYPSDF